MSKQALPVQAHVNREVAAFLQTLHDGSVRPIGPLKPKEASNSLEELQKASRLRNAWRKSVKKRSRPPERHGNFIYAELAGCGFNARISEASVAIAASSLSFHSNEALRRKQWLKWLPVVNIRPGAMLTPNANAR